VTQPPEDPPTPEDQPPPLAPPGPSWSDQTPQQPVPQPPPPPEGWPANAWQQPAWPQPGSPYEQPTKSGTNGFAIAALVFGILPICFLGIIFAIVALVQTSKSGQKGKGMAIAGLVLSVLWLAGIVTAGVVANLDNADRDKTGRISSEGKIHAEDLRIGDCFNGLNNFKAGSTITTVTGVPCSTLHEAEAFAKVELSESSYPGTESLQLPARGRACVEKLRTVAPDVYKAKSMGVIWIYPKSFSWKLGNHHLTCIAIGVGRSTGSISD